MLLAATAHPRSERVSFSFWEFLYLISFNRADNFIYTFAFCQPDRICSHDLFHTSFLVSSIRRRPLFAYVRIMSILIALCLKLLLLPPLPKEQNYYKSVDQRDEEYRHLLQVKTFLLFTMLPPRILIKVMYYSYLWIYFPFLKRGVSQSSGNKTVIIWTVILEGGKKTDSLKLGISLITIEWRNVNLIQRFFTFVLDFFFLFGLQKFFILSISFWSHNHHKNLRHYFHFS